MRVTCDAGHLFHFGRLFDRLRGGIARHVHRRVALLKQNPAVRYVVVEPTNASILSGKRKTQGRLELHEKTVIARRRLPKNLQRPDGQRPSGALRGVTAR